MKKIYGLPYKGSKNRIAEKIVEAIPRAAHFYDLFVGGGAVAHCAALSNKWRVMICRETDLRPCWRLI